MTLTTLVNFLEPTDPERVFGMARQIIGIPHEQPFEIDSPDLWDGQHFYPSTTRKRIRSKSGGFNAMLWVEMSPSGEGDLEDHRDEDYDEGECDTYHRPWFVQVMLDTTYGFEPCCTCLHYQIIRDLVPTIASRFEWLDEFTGEWHDDLPPARCKHHAH